MARPLRIQYPGAVYHVMNRGTAKCTIFHDRSDYLRFMALLEELVEPWKVVVHAVSLMPNHYHLLIETPHANLSRAMRHLNGVYTQRYNRNHKRDGPLFRGRYQAILVEEEAYLVELLRYIHLNSVRAHLMKRPQDHPWSSHRAYLSQTKGWEWLTTDRLLHYFGKRRGEARRKFHAFVMEGVPEGLLKQLRRDRWPSVFSSDNFRDWIQWNFVRDIKDRNVQYVDEPIRKISEQQLRKIICETFALSWHDLVNPVGGLAKKYRAIVLGLYRRHRDETLEVLSKKFGGLHPGSVSRVIQRSHLMDPDLWDYLNRMIENVKRKT